MKVLHILDQLNRGGTETLVLDLCKNAKKNNLNMLFVSLGGGDLEIDFTKTGIEFIKLHRKRSLDIRIIFQLRKIIKQKNIDIIHSHLIVAAVHAYFASLGLNVKNILTHHGITPGKKKIKDTLSERFLISRMNKNIVVTNAYLKRLKNEQKYDISKNFCVIYNGIDGDKFIKTEDEPNKNNKENKATVMGMVANFVKCKDQLTVCKALPAIFAKYPNTKFVFVGDKPLYQPLYFEECFDFCTKNNISDKVDFLGKRGDVPNFLKSLDLFVFSSLNESFGIAVVEAMLSGVPVILTDIASLLEVSDNGKYAKVYKRGNFKDLMEKIEELLLNSDEREILAVSSKMWAEKNFLIENHIKKLISVYEGIM